MKKIIIPLLSLALLAGCGLSHQEKELIKLQEEQANYTQTAEQDTEQAQTLTTQSGDLKEQSKEFASRSKNYADQTVVLKSEAQQNLEKAAELNDDIQKAKAQVK